MAAASLRLRFIRTRPPSGRHWVRRPPCRPHGPLAGRSGQSRLDRGGSALPAAQPNNTPRKLAAKAVIAIDPPKLRGLQGLAPLSGWVTGYDPWRDTDDTPFPLRCRVQQIAVTKGHGALRSRLHHHGHRDRRGNRLHVLFDGEDNRSPSGRVVQLRPELSACRLGNNHRTLGRPHEMSMRWTCERPPGRRRPSGAAGRIGVCRVRRCGGRGLSGWMPIAWPPRWMNVSVSVYRSRVCAREGRSARRMSGGRTGTSVS